MYSQISFGPIYNYQETNWPSYKAVPSRNLSEVFMSD